MVQALLALGSPVLISNLQRDVCQLSVIHIASLAPTSSSLLHTGLVTPASNARGVSASPNGFVETGVQNFGAAWITVRVPSSCSQLCSASMR